MTDDHGGPGGGTAAAIDTLDPILVRLAELLGELAGNEAAYELLVEEQEQAGTKSNEDSDKYGCPLGDFKFPGTYGFSVQSRFLHTVGQAPGDRERELQEDVTETWQKAYDEWTTGSTESDYRSRSRNVWEPDPVRMLDAVKDFSDLAEWLEEENASNAGWEAPSGKNAPDWLGELKKGWPATSESPQSFYAFWDDVNDKVGQYLHAAVRLTTDSAKATATISDFQINLIEAATRAKERVIEALKMWQEWQRNEGFWPTGEMEDKDVKTILGHTSYAAGLVGLIPGAGLPAGLVSAAAGGAVYFLPDQVAVMEALSADTATGIHQGFARDLDIIEYRMGLVLDEIQTTAPKDASEDARGGKPDHSDQSTTGSQSLTAYADDFAARRKDLAPHEVTL